MLWGPFHQKAYTCNCDTVVNIEFCPIKAEGLFHQKA